MAFYFDPFERREPPPPLPFSASRELLWQFLAMICMVLGVHYLYWRWTASLNYDALWFSLPLVIAETGSFIGLLLFGFNMWQTRDLPLPSPPARIGECVEDVAEVDRPISVDVFFATYNEDPELVRLGLREAKALRYPHPIDLRIHVLDDGRRASMRAVADSEGANYISRTNNIGFKAGNLRNAMERTSGDFIVICDADTRPLPTLLERTLGYFRDPKMAFVQTPQWFYDLPEPRRLPTALGAKLGLLGRALGRVAEAICGPIELGGDPLVNDPKMFYDVILRRRNWANAAFCCGAGSIHRREAVMEVALRSYGRDIERSTQRTVRQWQRASKEKDVAGELVSAIRTQEVLATELVPYKFHVSEDIYTSIVLHSDRERGWKSYLHPYVESKMLSPQDLLSWTVQRFKYAGGTLDIMVHDNPIFQRGMTLPQKLMYAATFWSYLGGIWNIIFLLAPIVYLFTGIAPLAAYSQAFYLAMLPFLLATELAMMVGTWGIPGYASKANYIAFFAVNLRALVTVLRGKKISFPVTPKTRSAERHVRLVVPQLTLMALTLAGILIGGARCLQGDPRFVPSAVFACGLWGLHNMFALSGIVRAGFAKPAVSD